MEEPINIPPIIQNPVSEEKSPKRNREEPSSSPMGTTDQQFQLSKQPKLTPLYEHEEHIASIQMIDTNAMWQLDRQTTDTIASAET